MQKETLWQADKGDGNFINPILFADYSDPDVIHVGETFYMTASSFNYTPGLPILTSKDLIHWKLVNYAVENIDYEQYNKPAHSKGIWAPAIRYHDDIFYIYYGMPDEGVFMVQADDPLGAWSDPVLVLEGKGYIDPCPFWDTDGRAYIVHGYAKSRIGFKSILGIFEMSWDGKKAIGDDYFIYDGTKTQPTIEGPKVYYKNGWYYIFAPAGGVKTGWQTVLRSRNIEGPYDEKVVMARQDTPTNGPHQGGLVDTPYGEEWFIHFQDRGVYGRIIHLQPVEWEGDWPIIGHLPNEKGCGKPVQVYQKPKGLIKVQPHYLEASDDFRNTGLDLKWQWLGNHSHNYYQIMKDEMCLRLFSLNPSGSQFPTLWESSNVLTQKVVCPSFEVETQLSVDVQKVNEQAGIVMMGSQYAYIAIRRDVYGVSIVYVESNGSDECKEETVIHRDQIANDVSEVKFIVKVVNEKPSDYEENRTIDNTVENDDVTVSMFYSIDNSTYVDTNHRFIPSGNGWVGAKIGLFSLALDLEDAHGYTEFDYIHVRRV